MITKEGAERTVWCGLFSAGMVFALLLLPVAVHANGVSLEGPPGQALLGMEISPQIKKERGYSGVEVVRVIPGSIAEKIGVRKGDLIFDICRRSISSISDLVDGLVRIAPDKKNTMYIVRDGSVRVLEFASDDSSYREDNYMFLVIGKHNKYASKTDILGIVYRKKFCRNISVQSVFEVIFKSERIGGVETTTVLGFIKSKKGKAVSILI